MAEVLGNFGSSTLNGGIDDNDTAIVVADGASFPSSGNYRVVIGGEIIVIGSRSGNTLTATTRGAESTTAVAHSGGAAIDLVLTAGALDQYSTEKVQSVAGMFLIQDETLGSDSSGGYTISNIPGTYKELLLEVAARTTRAVAAASVGVRFNSDTGSNYDYQYTQVNNTTVTGAIGTAVTSTLAGLAVGSTGTATRVGQFTIRIPNYAGTTFHKTIIWQAYADGGGTTNAYVRTGGGQWRSTSAITTIFLQEDAFAANWVQGSRFTLWGLK